MKIHNINGVDFLPGETGGTDEGLVGECRRNSPSPKINTASFTSFLIKRMEADRKSKRATSQKT